MAGLDILESAGRSLTGAVEKAYLELEDETVPAGQVEVTQVQKQSTGATSQLEQKMNQASKQADKVIDAVKKLTAPTTEKAQKRRFEVKFNPKELSFQAKGGNGTLVQKMNFAAKGKVSAKFSEMKTNILMHVPLVFDDMERTDAFMMEKFTDLTALTRTGVTGLVNEYALEKSYSVRPQVEGLLGPLHHDKTRKITFFWGQMEYRGILNSVDAEYTMFNMAGNPVRAVVNLKIILIDERVQDNEMGIWKKSYDAVFGEKDYTMDVATTLGSNLLNINL